MMTLDSMIKGVAGRELALLAEKAILLQQRVDWIVDRPSSYRAGDPDPRKHTCQARLGALGRSSGGSPRACNQLCFLNDSAREQLKHLDSLMRATLTRVIVV
jgi:hypothetical protein